MNPQFNSNNIIGLLKLSSYWNDDEFKKETIAFLNENMDSSLCARLVSNLFKEGFNDSSLEEVLQTYMTGLVSKAAEEPNCDVCFANKDPSLFLSILRNHLDCVKFLAREDKTMVNMPFHKQTQDNQIQFLMLYYEMFKQVYQNEGSPEMFLNERLDRIDSQALAYYSPLYFALKINKLHHRNCGSPLLECLLDNGAHGDYSEPGKDERTALNQALSNFVLETSTHLDDESSPSTTIIKRVLSYNHSKVQEDIPIIDIIAGEGFRYCGVSSKVRRRLDNLKTSHPNAYDKVKTIFMRHFIKKTSHHHNNGKDKIKKNFECAKNKFLEKVNNQIIE